MDYYELGQRIRRARKARGIPQERLAEQAGISVTHMSHIETGNTKLSLSVFAAIAQALEVPADELLSGSSAASQVRGELAALCDACTPAQLRVITELARAAKSAMEQQGFC